MIKKIVKNFLDGFVCAYKPDGKESELVEKIEQLAAEAVEMNTKNAKLLAAIKGLEHALNFNPRAAKLSLKQKPFIVVANDEPYYGRVYSLIRNHEIKKGTWTWDEDELAYQEAMRGGEE